MSFGIITANGEVKALAQNQSPKLGHPLFTNRKAHSRRTPRDKLSWPKNKPFRILSLDGGGIRGLFSACLLKKIETECCGNDTVGDFFDLIAGTSTGGIIAVGLGCRVPCSEIADLYATRGSEIFPPLQFKRSRNW